VWSDRLPPARRSRLVDRLRTVLPAPRPDSRGSRTPLRPLSSHAAASPEQVAAELRDRPGFAWLDGADPRLAADPLVRLTTRRGQATVAGPGGRIRFAARGLDLLEAALAAWGGSAGTFPDASAGTFSGTGWLVGYLGYELGGELEELPPPPPDDLDLPDLHLALYDTVLHWEAGGWLLAANDAWRAVPREAPEDLPTDPVAAAELLLEQAARRPVEPLAVGPLAVGPVVSRPGRAGFEAAVARAVQRIHAGEIFQVNLCRRLETRLGRADVWPLYCRLRAASPAAHGAFLDLGAGRALLSVSPESFLTVRDGEVTTRPIKGTRPRGRTPREDRALEEDLLASAKDRAELAMIVDVARNDLGRVATTGSVAVAAHAEILRLPTVLHTVSTVTARLRPDAGAADLLRAAFPPASITGAPKIQAMTVAAGEEERRRGPAMGAFGWIGLDGGAGSTLDLAVAIRTAAVARGRVAYHAGCGVTAASDPEEEYAETRAKARAFLSALGVEEPGESGEPG
jgi:para-aminobenzoate synthetase component 1